jgi:oxepin-CoA hydrolase/3-oxo-5,6-dehydrosuberyl-CoA semialdehyde dehydrogenase
MRAILLQIRRQTQGNIMTRIENYVLGSWTFGSGNEKLLLNAVTGQEVGVATANGIHFGEVLQYGRTLGGPVLRKMTFHERGRMLKALAMFLNERKAAYYELSYATGATKIDSWIDIDGGIGNLFAYASLRRQFPNERYYVDGDTAKLSKQGTFIGHHIMVPREGVAIHINAFNFPIWGMLEKIAVNLLAGMPAVVKPATITSYLTEIVVRDIIASGILPEGALQLICGNAEGLLDHVMSQDVVTFTGSASTGRKLKAHPRIIEESVHFNMEADSLNAAVLGKDAAPGTEEFDLFIKEVRKEVTVKCGQKCTAIRRVIVPEAFLEDVQIALGKAFSKTAVGNPRNEAVRMGSLAAQSQRADVLEKLALLREDSELVYGDPSKLDVIDASYEQGAFLSPMLLVNKDPFHKTATHEVEAFGPITTLMPYDTLDDAVALTKM